jgi:plastocyanin
LHGRRKLAALLAVAAVGFAVWGIGRAYAATFAVLAGAESADMAVQIDQFLPSAVTINVGDTVTWGFYSGEFHTVTFLAGEPRPSYLELTADGITLHPWAATRQGNAFYDGSGVRSSGLLSRRDEYSLTFTSPGQFPYVCLIHPEMAGEVTVIPAGLTGDTQASIDARIPFQLASALAERALPAILQFATVGTATTTEGDRSVVVAAGAGDGRVAVVRFMPANVVVHVNDLVSWVNQDAVQPHTVTFLAGEPRPENLVEVVQPDGTARWVWNPRVLRFQGLGVVDGTRFTTSGLLSREPGALNSFTLRFTRPGTFEYRCLLHDALGMTGTVTVVP